MTMPNFLVIGVTKCGTTSLYSYLKQHPEIFMSAVKEPQFFEFGEAEKMPLEFPARPWAFQTLEDYQRLFSSVTHEIAWGEATPSNFHARACRRIHQYIPHAKFICLLRQPVERGYSAFWMRQRLGTEPENDFRSAYVSSSQRWEHHKEMDLELYLGAAWYVDRLQDWFARFPRRQIHIGLYDDLKADPAACMRSIYTFLEVDHSFTPNTSQIHNQGAGVRSKSLSRWIRQTHPIKQFLRRVTPKPLRQQMVRGLLHLNQATLPPLDPYLRRELTRPQHDDILRLQDLIGRDLTHWLAE